MASIYKICSNVLPWMKYWDLKLGLKVAWFWVDVAVIFAHSLDQCKMQPLILVLINYQNIEIKFSKKEAISKWLNGCKNRNIPIKSERIKVNMHLINQLGSEKKYTSCRNSIQKSLCTAWQTTKAWEITRVARDLIM